MTTIKRKLKILPNGNVQDIILILFKSGRKIEMPLNTECIRYDPVGPDVAKIIIDSLGSFGAEAFDKILKIKGLYGRFRSCDFNNNTCGNSEQYYTERKEYLSQFFKFE